METLYRLS